MKYGGAALAGSRRRRGRARVVRRRTSRCCARSASPRSWSTVAGPRSPSCSDGSGCESEFVDGHRVTDAETLEIARMVLVGKVNSELVAAINATARSRWGSRASTRTSCASSCATRGSGSSATWTTSTRRLLHGLSPRGSCPVVATMGSDAAGQAYNVNADAAAGALAAALGATKLVVLTDVDGHPPRPGRPGDAARPADGRRARGDGRRRRGDRRHGAEGRGLRRRRCAAGVGAAHLLDGRVPHAALLELFTDRGVGTMVTLAGATTREAGR